MGSVEVGPRELCIRTNKIRRGSLWRWQTRGQPSLRNISIAFSSHSTRQSPAGPGWGCPSVVPSSMHMGVSYGPRRTSLAAPCFASPCLTPKEISRILCRRADGYESGAEMTYKVKLIKWLKLSDGAIRRTESRQIAPNCCERDGGFRVFRIRQDQPTAGISQPIGYDFSGPKRGHAHCARKAWPTELNWVFECPRLMDGAAFR
jgi:hypothetical protein